MPQCPFCEHGTEEIEVDRIDRHGQWAVRVVKNAYPFAPVHEIIIHSPHHDKDIDHLTEPEVEDILTMFRRRFQTHQSAGQVVIFHNSGHEAGASLSHPHSQLVVVPHNVKLSIRSIPGIAPYVPHADKRIPTHYAFTHDSLTIMCPPTSQWPDEVWLIPTQSTGTFADARDEDLSRLARALNHVIVLLKARHQSDIPYNFYISPYHHWYIRIMPRVKTLGGFELATGVSVMSQSPEETLAFLQEHWETPDFDRIRTHQKAHYAHGV
jgi:UDPglucose--hexose-1-phosphate uridylyltransferase